MVCDSDLYPSSPTLIVTMYLRNIHLNIIPSFYFLVFQLDFAQKSSSTKIVRIFDLLSQPYA